MAGESVAVLGAAFMCFVLGSCVGWGERAVTEIGREEKNKREGQEAYRSAYPTELWLQFRYMRRRVA